MLGRSHITPSGLELSPGCLEQAESQVGPWDTSWDWLCPFEPKGGEPGEPAGAPLGRGGTGRSWLPTPLLPELVVGRWHFCGKVAVVWHKSLDLSQTRPRAPACHQGDTSFLICHSLSKNQGELSTSASGLTLSTRQGELWKAQRAAWPHAGTHNQRLLLLFSAQSHRVPIQKALSRAGEAAAGAAGGRPG